MDLLFNILLIIHIATGSTGLLTGTITLVLRKGDKQHRNIGRLFCVSMLAAGGSALLLAIMHPNYFLFIVGIFTIYMVSTGWRYLLRRAAPIGSPVARIDYLLSYGMLGAAVVFVGFGGYLLAGNEQFGIVFLLFGFISLRWIVADLKAFKSKTMKPNQLIAAHLQRMLGAYIASLTAFIVVNNNDRVPAIVAWLLPTVIITPLIFRWSAQYLKPKKTSTIDSLEESNVL